MKAMTKIGAGLALATVCAASAYAIPPNTVPAANRVHFSGATATDSVLENLFLLASGGICQPGTIDVYRGVNQRAIFCTGAVTGLNGVPIGFLKESLGGSGNGVGPVASATSLQFLNVDSGSFACTGGPTNVPASGALTGYTERTGCTPNTGVVPAAGISDVEPRLLNASPAQIANLTSNGVLGIVFGPGVSLNLYRALQTAQGLALNDLPANVPSLSTSQINALFTGFYVDWSQFSDLAGAVPADSNVYVCRRGRSSGTQSSYETFFLNQRCSVGVTGFLEPTNSSCLASGCNWNASFINDTTFAGSSSGDVRLCLDAHDDDNTWAIGVLSTESTYNNTDREFRYVRVDGALPTLDATANGQYNFFTENTINRRNGALSGVPLTLVNFLTNNLGNPTLLDQVNAPFRSNPHGDGGALAVPNFSTIFPNTPPVTQAEIRTNPVNAQTRNGNNCSRPLMIGDSDSNGS